MRLEVGLSDYNAKYPRPTVHLSADDWATIAVDLIELPVKVVRPTATASLLSLWTCGKAIAAFYEESTQPRRDLRAGRAIWWRAASHWCCSITRATSAATYRHARNGSTPEARSREQTWPIQPMTHGLNVRPSGLDCRVDHLCETHALLLERDFAFGDAGDIEQFFDEACRVGGLPLRGSSHAPHADRSAVKLGQLLDEGQADAGALVRRRRRSLDPVKALDRAGG